MIAIDGSSGEGGGQILRTALALSLHTGAPLRIEKIRAGRAKPGLLRQHLTAVLAAAEIGGAHVEGADLGSTELTFRPGRVRPGEIASRWARRAARVWWCRRSCRRSCWRIPHPPSPWKAELTIPVRRRRGGLGP